MNQVYQIKCAPVYEELLVAAKYSQVIELQLIDEFDGSLTQQAFYLNLIKAIPAKVLTVHTPLRKGGDVDLCYIHLPQMVKDFEATCRLAEELSILYQEKVLVVVHYGGAAELDPNREVILKTLADMLSAYPHIRIGIENVVPIVKHGNQFLGRCGSLDEVPRLIHLFWQSYGQTPRIGSVLDTCHAMTTERLLGLCGASGYDLTWFFCLFHDTLIHIHLANLLNLGYQKGEHGCAFDKERDALVLTEIASAYHRYGAGASIAIEVFELNYLTRPHYAQSAEAAAHYFGKGLGLSHD